MAKKTIKSRKAKQVMMGNRKAIKYPKLALLCATLILGYIFFTDRQFSTTRESLAGLGYIGTFFAGIFFSYGFTAAPATAVLLVLGRQENILLASVVGGLGALLGDTIIFRLIRHSFAEEFSRLSREKSLTTITGRIPKNALKYIVPAVAGFIIASPLPDEIGVALLAASTHVSGRAFTMISFALNTIGIFAILHIGQVL